MTSFAVNYTLQKSFVFGTRGAHGRALTRYVILVVANLLFTALVVQWAVDLGIPWVVGKLGVTICVTIVNFLTYKSWVFTSTGAEAGVGHV